MSSSHAKVCRSFLAGVLLCGTLLFATISQAAIRVQLPQGTTGATDRAECRALSEAWSNLSRQLNDAHSQCLASPRCKGSHSRDESGVCSCGICHDLHVMMNRVNSSRQDIGAQREYQIAQCNAQVQAHEERMRAQRHAMQEANRRAQQDRAYQERLNQQYASELAARQRELERRQPVVVGTVPPNPGGASRTTIIPIAPAQPQREAQREARESANRQQQDQAALLGNAIQQLANIFKGGMALNKNGPPDESTAKSVGKLVEKNDELRRQSIDSLLNPNQDRNDQIDRNIANAQTANSEVNQARGISGLVSQISNDALAAIGALQNRVFGDFGRAMKQAESLGGDINPPSTAAPSVLRSSPDPALQGSDAMLEQAPVRASEGIEPTRETPTVDPSNAMPERSEAAVRGERTWEVASSMTEEEQKQSPMTACRPLAQTEQADCMVRQCKLEKFKSHAMCSKPAQ